MKKEDITNQTFGNLIAKEIIGQNNRYEYLWKCLCSCGKDTITTKYSLISGNTKSCGCFKKQRTKEIKFKNLEGKRFSNLTVIKVSGKNKYGEYMWECLCNCGKVTKVRGPNLSSGNSKSCGCVRDLYSKSDKNKKMISSQGKKKVLPNKQSAFNIKFRSYKNDAKIRNHAFELNMDEFKTLILQNCFYCNKIPPNTVKSRCDTINYNGIDRVDNMMGYTLKNCVPCCPLCNFMKRNLTLSDFFSHIKEIINFSTQKGRIPL